MDFFAAQELRRKKTKWLVLMYCAAVATTILGIYLGIEIAMSFASPQGNGSAAAGSGGAFIFRPWLFSLIAILNIVVIGGASLMKIVELRSGGHHVAAQLGGVRVPATTTDLKEKRLLNVVEEMALASGVSVPPVYIMNHEPGINAFAAGYSPADAVIGVNRGTIDLLNRDELQGVIAHEFSHILNGDMRMNIRLIGVLFGIQMISTIGYFVLRTMGHRSGRRSKDDNSGAFFLAIAVALLVFGSMGQFFARLIKASISRQREFLADASAVQFTRYPDGIAGALKVIGGSANGSVILSKEAEELSHMFFANGLTSKMASFFATHPPLMNRILKVDPGFGGDYQDYFQRRNELARQREDERKNAQETEEAETQSNSPLGRLFPAAIVERFPIDPVFLLSAIGAPDVKDVRRSKALIRQLPENLLTATRHPFSARCIAFAMLMSDDDAIRTEQMDLLKQREPQATCEQTEQLIDVVTSLHLIFRLPVLELIQGSLADLSRVQYQQFRGTVEALVKLDGQTSLFEFVVRHHLLMHLDRRFEYRPRPSVKYNQPQQLRREMELMFSAFASASVSGSVLEDGGPPDEQVVLEAYRLAMQVAGFESAAESQAELESWEVEQLDECMLRLHHAAPLLKKKFLHAAAVLISFDHEITITEAEFFRAVAESLDCPVPVFAAGRLKRG